MNLAAKDAARDKEIPAGKSIILPVSNFRVGLDEQAL